MRDLINILKEKPMFNGSNGATAVEIQEAEIKLSVSFSEEYKDYLSYFGLAVFEGHELTGICRSKRLNVVDVTICERELTDKVPDDWYVIEQLNIDGLVIWQSSNGNIFQTMPNKEPIKIAENLLEYVLNCN